VFRKNRRDFVAHKLAEKMARPPYFLHMEEVNLLPGRPLKWPSTFHVLQPSEFQHRMEEGLVIDTRSPEAFAAAHIPGTYNIWLDGVPAFGGWVANENTRIFLVAEGAEAIELAVMSLARIGIDTGPVVAGVIGKTKFSYEVWGDTVNTAWHMETYGAPGCIQVNETTHARLREKYTFEDRGDFFVKDKADLKTYFLKSRK
jgi:hydroxyacylglutathione hydrolase